MGVLTVRDGVRLDPPELWVSRKMSDVKIGRIVRGSLSEATGVTS